MIVERRPDGTIVLDAVARWIYEDFLLPLPELLGREPTDAARRRLYPDPVADDPEAAAEWRRHQVPELFALLASAREVVAADLALTPRPDLEQGLYRVEIPPGHVNAWISGLNAARLVLFEENGFDEEDMAEDAEVTPEIARVHVYGLLQELLIEGSPLG